MNEVNRCFIYCVLVHKILPKLSGCVSEELFTELLQQQLGFMLPVMQNDFLGPSPNSFCLQPVIIPLSFSELLLFVFNSYWLLWLSCQQAFNWGPEIASIQFSLETWHLCHLLQFLRHRSTSSVLTFERVFKSLFLWIFLFFFYFAAVFILLVGFMLEVYTLYITRLRQFQCEWIFGSPP